MFQGIFDLRLFVRVAALEVATAKLSFSDQLAAIGYEFDEMAKLAGSKFELTEFHQSPRSKYGRFHTSIGELDVTPRQGKATLRDSRLPKEVSFFSNTDVTASLVSATVRYAARRAIILNQLPEINSAETESSSVLDFDSLALFVVAASEAARRGQDFASGTQEIGKMLKALEAVAKKEGLTFSCMPPAQHEQYSEYRTIKTSAGDLELSNNNKQVSIIGGLYAGSQVIYQERGFDSQALLVSSVVRSVWKIAFEKGQVPPMRAENIRAVLQPLLQPSQ